MDIRINPITMISPQGITEVASVKNSPSQSFTDVLQSFIKDVNQLQQKADASTEKLVLGEINDVHQVMLDTEKAKLSLELTVQIRNKLIEAYQEMSRMQF